MWPLGKAAWNTHQAHRAIGEVVPQALALAICPDNPSDPTAQRAANLIHDRLRHTDILADTGRQPGRLKRGWNWATSQVGSERAPKAALYGESEFLTLLWRWLCDALKDPTDEITRALNAVTCRNTTRDAAPTPDVLAVYFPVAFLRTLRDSQGSAWRTGLLNSLIQAEKNRQDWKGYFGWVDLLLPPAVGTAAGAVAHLAGASDLASVVLGLAGLGIVIPAELRSVWEAQNRGGGSRHAVREHTSTWLDDCLALLTNAAKVTQSRLATIAELRKRQDRMQPPDPLMQHLALLVTEAEMVGESQLASQLNDIQHTLQRVRYNAGQQARNNAIDALQRLAELLYDPSLHQS